MKNKPIINIDNTAKRPTESVIQFRDGDEFWGIGVPQANYRDDYVDPTPFVPRDTGDSPPKVRQGS